MHNKNCIQISNPYDDRYFKNHSFFVIIFPTSRFTSPSITNVIAKLNPFDTSISIAQKPTTHLLNIWLEYVLYLWYIVYLIIFVFIYNLTVITNALAVGKLIYKKKHNFIIFEIQTTTLQSRLSSRPGKGSKTFCNLFILFSSVVFFSKSVSKTPVQIDRRKKNIIVFV